MAQVDSKILVNSPFKIVRTSSTITKGVLNIWVYKGLQGSAQPAGTIAPPSNGRTAETLAFNLTSTSVGLNGSDYIAFEISSLVRGFIVEKYAGDSNVARTESNVYVDYQLTTYVGDTATIEALVRCVAFDGYSNYEEGVNYQSDTNGLITADIISRLEDTPIEIGVDNATTGRVSFLNNGNLVNTREVYISNWAFEQIDYVTSTYNNAERLEKRVENDGGTFEGSRCLDKFRCTDELFDCDEVYIEDRSGEVRVLKVNTLEKTQHEPYKVTFVNKEGAFEHIWFIGNSREKIAVKSKQYNRITSDYTQGGSYSVSDAPRYKQRLSSNKEITLNSGFHPERSNSSFEQLIQSDDVWIEYKNQVLPLLIKNTSFNLKTHLNDNAINYTINAEFAFNRINNI